MGWLKKLIFIFPVALIATIIYLSQPDKEPHTVLEAQKYVDNNCQNYYLTKYNYELDISPSSNHTYPYPGNKFNQYCPQAFDIAAAEQTRIWDGYVNDKIANNLLVQLQVNKIKCEESSLNVLCVALNIRAQDLSNKTVENYQLQGYYQNYLLVQDQNRINREKIRVENERQMVYNRELKKSESAAQALIKILESK